MLNIPVPYQFIPTATNTLQRVYLVPEGKRALTSIRVVNNSNGTISFSIKHVDNGAVDSDLQWVLPYNYMLKTGTPLVIRNIGMNEKSALFIVSSSLLITVEVQTIEQLQFENS